MLHDISHDTLRAGDPSASAASGEFARQQAIKRIERKRKFWISAAMGTLGMLLLTAIWAISEYNNAGGWPASGFSQSSSIPDVWNYWIIYPAIAWAFLIAAGWFTTYFRKPISESKIKREIERQAR